jgi:hypothetical protein
MANSTSLDCRELVLHQTRWRSREFERRSDNRLPGVLSRLNRFRQWDDILVSDPRSSPPFRIPLTSLSWHPAHTQMQDISLTQQCVFLQLDIECSGDMGDSHHEAYNA